MQTGPRNLITDVEGLRVGNAEDHHIKSGTTVLIGDRPFRASFDVMGGSPGARETELLAPTSWWRRSMPLFSQAAPHSVSMPGRA